MAEVRPDEVSAILRQQLAGFKTEKELEEVGTVPRLEMESHVSTDSRGFSPVNWSNLKTDYKGSFWTLEEDNVGAVLLGVSSNIKRRML